MNAEAFSAIWYCCPNCNTKNTERIIDNPRLTTGFNCKKCRSVWTVELLYRAFGTIFPSEYLFAYCSEFTCECGCVNTLFSRKTLESEKVNDERKLVVENLDCAKFGLCEECGASYDLVYPMPESVDKWLLQKGFPFNGTKEEQSRWIEENG